MTRLQRWAGDTLHTPAFLLDPHNEPTEADDELDPGELPDDEPDDEQGALLDEWEQRNDR